MQISNTMKTQVMNIEMLRETYCHCGDLNMIELRKLV